MELNGLETDESLVKTQMTVTKKKQNTKKSNKKQNEKTKKQMPTTVPDKTLKSSHCRYCKEAGPMMAECPKLAKWRKLEEDPMQQNVKTATHQVKKKKTATSAPTWKTDHRSGTLWKSNKRLSKHTNKLENRSKQK